MIIRFARFISMGAYESFVVLLKNSLQHHRREGVLIFRTIATSTKFRLPWILETTDSHSTAAVILLFRDSTMASNKIISGSETMS